MDLGHRSKRGVLDNTNPLGAGFWTVTFDPQFLAVRVRSDVYHIAISGPAGSSFQLFIDNTFYDYVVRGDVNSWDPSQPMHVRPGQSLYFYWNTASTPAPTVSIFLRQTP